MQACKSIVLRCKDAAVKDGCGNDGKEGHLQGFKQLTLVKPSSNKGELEPGIWLQSSASEFL